MIYSSTIHSQAGRNREQEYLHGWQRARAELDNFRKRLMSTQESDRIRLKQELAAPLLDIADNLAAMSAHVPEKFKEDNWTTGVMHIVKKFEDMLGTYEIATINEVHVPFNPSQHEAVSEKIDEGVPAGHVITIVSPGYRIGSHTVRPAKVIVSS